MNAELLIAGLGVAWLIAAPILTAKILRGMLDDGARPDSQYVTRMRATAAPQNRAAVVPSIVWHEAD